MVEAIVKGLESDYNEIVNLGTGKGTSVGEIVNIISDLTKTEIVHLNQEETGPTKIICDIDLVKENLNWTPKTDIKKGLFKTYEYYKKIIK